MREGDSATKPSRIERGAGTSPWGRGVEMSLRFSYVCCPHVVVSPGGCKGGPHFSVIQTVDVMGLVIQLMVPQQKLRGKLPADQVINN